MRGLVIVKNGTDIKKVNNVKGFIEMNIRRLVDKLDCKLVYDERNTVIFIVDTDRKNFEFIKEQLEVACPGECVFVEPKEKKKRRNWIFRK